MAGYYPHGYAGGPPPGPMHAPPMWHGPPPGYRPPLPHPGGLPPGFGGPPPHGLPPHGPYGHGPPPPRPAPFPGHGPAPFGAPPHHHGGAPPLQGGYLPPDARHLHGGPGAYPPPEARPPTHGAPGGPPPARPPHGVGAPAPAQELDFAAEKPAAYRAFEQMAVHSGEGGTTIGLPNAMCLDRHVPDFLKCLECWLGRSFGQPTATQRPWRLQCLDLSRNSLGEESLCRVMETLKRLDIRIERLWLAGNFMRERGLAAMTEYMWNCKDALVEVDVTDNEIVADPTTGPEPGNDMVTAFLRCLYNHSAYPLMLEHGGMKVLPLLLRMGGNFISHPDKLLRQIRSKGGRSHVRICASADPYDHGGQKEYLSVCLPEFLTQRATNGSVAAAAAPVAPAVAAAAPAEAPAPAAAPGQNGKRERGKKEKKEEKEKKRRKEPKDRSDKHKGDGSAAAPIAQVAADGAPGGALNLSDADQKRLQDAIDHHLRTDGGLPPGEESTREMLSEFAVCMIVAKKGMKEIEEELAPFLGEHAGAFADWFELHLQDHFPDLMGQLRRFWSG
mmetsp:Transcript_44364/g.141075  ORF Transcript_44364/g.141075 Transcript_44364/m.141075 type:complete len:558 (+) Transcript_44364:82-1755(+)